ncbi:GNAT family N-acetyltransferase [Qipengyuania sp. SS22]|uniref:GNAT family N-acetyltransferase n=1 Tax=Qipengyuania sp. SS22 TaxID=2979461 RepID=UPI0021E6084E|nr:GNAT family N-acetyltransferase [Qipengyuania sp. SS22]UYH55908.1 GNAT family N-acetyltransferase [Qipengyuania sp. SS22]
MADDDIRSLITLHQQRMYDASPPGTSFALDLSGLEGAAATVLEARDADTLLGVGALFELSPSEGEIKSMRTADSALRRGVGQVLLDHIVTIARERGYRRLLLETGTGETFEPANRLYLRNGFTRCAPFGDYAETQFNIFYELAL